MAYSTYSYCLSFLGLGVLASWSQRLLSFVHLHFIHRSTLPNFVTSKSAPKTSSSPSASYALVTGASAGIGHGFAEELLIAGFNVILHGRNHIKLEKAKASLQQQYPNSDIRVFVLDVSDQTNWFAAINQLLTSLKNDNISLRVLINNVGGGPAPPRTVLSRTLDRPADDTNVILNLNATFTSTFTQALLPVLVQNQPSAIINIGSGAMMLPVPHLALYGGSKAFLSRWSRCFSVEMETEGLNVEVYSAVVGKVINQGTSDDAPSLFVPSSRVMAKAALDKLGSGTRECAPYWPHAVQQAVMSGVPEWLLEKICKQISKTEMEAEKQRMAKSE